MLMIDGWVGSQPMTEIFYYLIAATITSFVWLLLSGHRPHGERRLVGAFYFALVIGSTVLVFAVWRRLLLLSIGLGLINAIMVGLLWPLLPDWNTRGHTFLLAFTGVQIIFIVRIAWAIATGGLGLGAILLSLVFGRKHCCFVDPLLCLRSDQCYLPHPLAALFSAIYRIE
jgi:MFS family permease